METAPKGFAAMRLEWALAARLRQVADRARPIDCVRPKRNG
jgi:hypothetical protein